MAWQDPVQVEALAQSVLSDVVTLNPAETAHVQVKRGSGSSTDLILVQVFGTLEDNAAERDVVPLFAFGLRATETSLSFIMRGVWGFYVLLLNGASSPVGTISGDLRYRKDGVDVG